MKFDVFLKDFVQYGQIEANTKEEAIEIALEWWTQRIPEILVEDENDDYTDYDLEVK